MNVLTNDEQVRDATITKTIILQTNKAKYNKNTTRYTTKKVGCCILVVIAVFVSLYMFVVYAFVLYCVCLLVGRIS